MVSGRTPDSFSPEHRQHAAYCSSRTHAIYRAAWIAAGKPVVNLVNPHARNQYMTWGKRHNIPLGNIPFEEWVAMNKPLTYVAPEPAPAPTLVIAEPPAPIAEEEALWECAAYLPVHVPDVLPPAPAKQFWIHSF